MDERGEGCALATRGEVARPEVGDGRHARALGDDGRGTDLQRGADDVRPFLSWQRQVVDRLAVRADQVHCRQRQSGPTGDRDGRLGEQLPKVGIEMAHLFRTAPRRRGQYTCSQSRWIGKRLEGQEVDGRPRTARPNVDHGGIHAIGGRAGHETDDVHGLVESLRQSKPRMGYREASPRNSAFTRARASASVRRSTAVMAMALAAANMA